MEKIGAIQIAENAINTMLEQFNSLEWAWDDLSVDQRNTVIAVVEKSIMDLRAFTGPEKKTRMIIGDL